MTAIDHLAALRDDGTALAVAAGQGLDAAVPACDGWTVADLVLHTGMVHRHKLAHRPDQTAGFWRRRMAQETVVHRVDAESAHGRASPVPAALAAETGDRWQVRLLPTGIEVGPGQATADASAAGGAADLLLWLWGRGPADPLGRTGDPALVPRVRELAAEATQ
jgi:MDMPI C-terminal domain/Mycothiol maleylpyruvate isomerase N-terminal domain